MELGSTNVFISLLGRFCLQVGSTAARRTIALESLKAQELLCFLLLHRDRAHPREALAGTLWGNTPAAQAKLYLRKALWQLQQALAQDELPAGQRLLRIEPEWLQVNPEAPFWLDVAEIQGAFACVAGLPGGGLDGTQAERARRAVLVYRGDLLDGWYHDWCLFERERLQDQYVALLDKLMAFCEARAEFEQGLAYGDSILRVDQAREQTHRRLMRLHYLAGDRTGALRQYDRCVAALEKELSVAPTPLTTALRDQIRADTLERAPAEPAPAGTPTPELEGLLGHLQQLQASLTQLQQKIQNNIRAVEQTLSRR